MIDDKLTEGIIAAAYKVHNALGGGFLEKVYENAMAIELAKRGLKVAQQFPIDVYYEEVLVGKYFADLLVNDVVPVELKAAENLAKEHEVQLVHYLTATKLDVGLLINFGASVTVKRKYRQYKKPVNPEIL